MTASASVLAFFFGFWSRDLPSFGNTFYLNTAEKSQQWQRRYSLDQVFRVVVVEDSPGVTEER